jgi:chromosome segregation ATPase
LENARLEAQSEFYEKQRRELQQQLSRLQAPNDAQKTEDFALIDYVEERKKQVKTTGYFASREYLKNQKEIEKLQQDLKALEDKPKKAADRIKSSEKRIQEIDQNYSVSRLGTLDRKDIEAKKRLESAKISFEQKEREYQIVETRLNREYEERKREALQSWNRQKDAVTSRFDQERQNIKNNLSATLNGFMANLQRIVYEY